MIYLGLVDGTETAIAGTAGRDADWGELESERIARLVGKGEPIKVMGTHWIPPQRIAWVYVGPDVVPGGRLDPSMLAGLGIEKQSEKSK